MFSVTVGMEIECTSFPDFESAEAFAQRSSEDDSKRHDVVDFGFNRLASYKGGEKVFDAGNYKARKSDDDWSFQED